MAYGSYSASPRRRRPAKHLIDVTRRPSTPLAEAALLTKRARRADRRVRVSGHELATCDEVDLLCAFVMWPGLRLLESELRDARDRGVPFRVVTTTYLGGTERAALDRLVRDYGAEVKVQYDARRARLHAKAWLFRRHSGFDTRLHRFVEPFSRRAARRHRVECPTVPRRNAEPSGQVPRHLRHLLELRLLRQPTTRIPIVTGSTTHWLPRVESAQVQPRSACLASNSARTPISRRSLSRWSPSGPTMIGTGIS